MIDSSIILPSKPKIIQENETRGVYETDGLYPGYGHTLGNSLRRIILSSLPGTAITSVKIDGVTHEFATLPGIKEDIVMLILNLKKVRFHLVGDEPQAVALEVKGARTVTSGDIKTSSQVTVLNKDLYLATLTDKKASLKIEMNVAKGLGYVPKVALQAGRQEIGTIYLDAVFTPIRRVSYEVENMRVGDRTDYNRLRISIETDGTITPHEALVRSIEIMVNQLKAMVGFREEEMAEAVSASPTVMPDKTAETVADRDQTSEALKTRIEDLDLSVRVTRALTGAGIRTVGGLVRKREADLEEVEGLGGKGIQEIKKAISNLGLTLKE